MVMVMRRMKSYINQKYASSYGWNGGKKTTLRAKIAEVDRCRQQCGMKLHEEREKSQEQEDIELRRDQS